LSLFSLRKRGAKLNSEIGHADKHIDDAWNFDTLRVRLLKQLSTGVTEDAFDWVETITDEVIQKLVVFQVIYKVVWLVVQRMIRWCLLKWAVLVYVRSERLFEFSIEYIEISSDFQKLKHCLFNASKGEKFFDTHC